MSEQELKGYGESGLGTGKLENLGSPHWSMRACPVVLLRFQLEILRRRIGAFLRGKKGPRSQGGSG